MSRTPDHRDIDGARRFRTLREAAGLTLEALAQSIGYSASHLSNVERGEKRASEELVRRYESLAKAGHQGLPPPVARARKVPATRTADLHDDDFGTRMMRLRIANGWSLSMLASRACISRSYLGKLEIGQGNPSAAVAHACDKALAAEGELIRLAGTSRRRARTAPEPPKPDDLETIASRDPDELLQSADGDLRRLRRAGQRERPWSVIPDLVGQARTLASTASAVRGAQGRELWMYAARFAEFAGWMLQEAGEDDVADRWTLASARWAVTAGDPDMRSYRWERKALIALYRGDAQATIGLARLGAAQRGATPRVLGLALRREAQGHALAGNQIACQRTLRKAATLIGRGPAPYPAGASWGPVSIDDMSTFVEASCLVDLGLHRQAVELFALDPAPPRAPAVIRTRCRFGVREALALAGTGEIDHACATVAGLLADIAEVDSATLRSDVLRLISALNRHRSHPQAQEILPALRNLVRPRLLESGVA